jgi:hypothetical protein
MMATLGGYLFTLIARCPLGLQGTRGGPGVAPGWAAGAGAAGHMAAPELPRAGQRELEPQGTWRPRSGFTTLPPVPLQEQYRCGSFVGGGFGLLVASYEEIRWTRRFMWFGPTEHNTLCPRVKGVVLLCLSA